MRLVDMFCEVLALPQPPAGLDIVRFRNIFAKQLIAHLTREDWLLYPSLLQSSDKRVAATAQDFIDEMGGLMRTYKAWSAKWPTDAARADWSGFVADTTDLLSQLAHRVERENNELYPLVEVPNFKAA